METETVPQLDEALTGAPHRQREPSRRYLLQLSKGLAQQRMHATIAGELWIRLLQPSVRSLDASATKRMRVVAAPAILVDVVNLPEQGHSGVDFEIAVRALDQFGKCVLGLAALRLYG